MSEAKNIVDNIFTEIKNRIDKEYNKTLLEHYKKNIFEKTEYTENYGKVDMSIFRGIKIPENRYIIHKCMFSIGTTNQFPDNGFFLVDNFGEVYIFHQGTGYNSTWSTRDNNIIFATWVNMNTDMYNIQATLKPSDKFDGPLPNKLIDWIKQQDSIPKNLNFLSKLVKDSVNKNNFFNVINDEIINNENLETLVKNLLFNELSMKMDLNSNNETNVPDLLFFN